MDGEVVDFYDCPVGLADAQVHEFLRKYQYWRGERPWYAGGVGDWPERDLRRLDILGDEVRQLDEIRRKEDADRTRWERGG